MASSSAIFVKYLPIDGAMSRDNSNLNLHSLQSGMHINVPKVVKKAKTNCTDCKKHADTISKLKRELAELKTKYEDLAKQYQVLKVLKKKKETDTQFEIIPFRITPDTLSYLLAMRQSHNNTFASDLFECKDNNTPFDLNIKKPAEIKKLLSDLQILTEDILSDLISTHEFSQRMKYQTRFFNIIECIFQTHFGEDFFPYLQQTTKKLWDGIGSEPEFVELKKKGGAYAIESFDQHVTFSQVFKVASFYSNLQTVKDLETEIKFGKKSSFPSEIKILEMAVNYVGVMFHIFEDKMLSILETQNHGKSFKANSKTFDRAKMKLDEYSGDGIHPSYERIADLLRCKAVFEDPKHLLRAYEAIGKEYRIIRTKNKLNTPLHNIQINFIFQDMVAEAQLCLGEVKSYVEKHQLYEIYRCRSIGEVYSVVKGWGGYDHISSTDVCKAKFIDSRPMSFTHCEREKFIPISKEFDNQFYRVIRTQEFGDFSIVSEEWEDKIATQSLVMNHKLQVFGQYKKPGILNISCSARNPIDLFASNTEIKTEKLSLNVKEGLIIRVSGKYQSFSDKEGESFTGITYVNCKTKDGQTFEIGDPKFGDPFEIFIPDGYYVVGFGGRKRKPFDKWVTSLYCWISTLEICMITNDGEVKYEGQMKDGKKEGKGICEFSNQDWYEGEWKNDQMEGKGIYYHNNGDRYEGAWVNGKRDGKGKKYFTSGNIYEGEWIEDMQGGFGELRYENMDFYEGYWKEGKREGLGIMHYANNTRYEGEWKEDLFHGKGTFYEKSGTFYEGNFQAGILSLTENAKITYISGKSYEGKIKELVPHGEGTMIFTDGTKYQGNWVEGYAEGEGTVFFKNGEIFTGTFARATTKVENVEEYNIDHFHDSILVSGKGLWVDQEEPWKFEGEWKNYSKQGDIIQHLDDGRKLHAVYLNGILQHGQARLNRKIVEADQEDHVIYEGDFLNDKPEGFGIATYQNGDTYEGDWKNGQRDGKGKFHQLSSGITIEGTWNVGKVQGEATITKSDGTIWEGEYKEGKIFNGKGILNLNPGIYEGDVKDGLRHGQGRFYFTDDKMDYYEGNWENDKQKGFGAVYNIQKNENYNGEWDESMHGNITFFIANDLKFEAKYQNGKPWDGTAVTYINNKIVARMAANYKEGNLEGKCTIDVDEIHEEYSHHSNLKKDEMKNSSGGKMKSSNREKENNRTLESDGEYVNMVIEASNLLKSFDSTSKTSVSSLEIPDKKKKSKKIIKPQRYELMYKENLREGPGKIIFKNGMIFEGNWAEDSLHGEGTLIVGDQVYKQIYDHDVFSKGTEYLVAGDMVKLVMIPEETQDFKKIETLIYPKGHKQEIFWKGDRPEMRRYFYNPKGDKMEADCNEDSTIISGTAFVFSDTSSYEGEFKDKMYDGKGVYTTSSGSRFEGTWKAKRKHGPGVHYFSNGDRLESTWEENKQNGPGVLYYANGDRLVSNFVNMLANGQGEYYFKDIKLVGKYHKGKIMEGVGVIKYENGHFIGQFKGAEKNGEGSLFEFGKEFKGTYRYGKILNGMGIYYLVKDHQYPICMGKFENGVLKGKVTCYNKEGEDDKFFGVWEDGKPVSGKAIFVYDNNEKYEGEYKDGFKHGRGKYYYNDGSIYDGEWERGLRTGKGETIRKFTGIESERKEKKKTFMKV